jgi:hypothetical protein
MDKACPGLVPADQLPRVFSRPARQAPASGIAYAELHEIPKDVPCMSGSPDREGAPLLLVQVEGVRIAGEREPTTVDRVQGRAPSIRRSSTVWKYRLQGRRDLAADFAADKRGARRPCRSRPAARRWSGKAASPLSAAVVAAEALDLALALGRVGRRRASGPSRCRSGSYVYGRRDIGRWKARLQLGRLVGFRSSAPKSAALCLSQACPRGVGKSARSANRRLKSRTTDDKTMASPRGRDDTPRKTNRIARMPALSTFSPFTCYEMLLRRLL